jgi:glycosyltransferase involved in cell wall biosynthesis
MHNLPVIAHNHPVMQYVIGEAGTLTDLEKTGNLRSALENIIIAPAINPVGREYVKQKFDWKVLAPQYRAMFQKVAAGD